MAALGALIVYCAAVVTMAFQVFLGTIGVGLTLILFVVLGNPSAGGAYPAPLLPGFWRAISPALPNGAGVQALRRIVYFGSYNITDNLLIISLYIVVAAPSRSPAQHSSPPRRRPKTSRRRRLTNAAASACGGEQRWRRIRTRGVPEHAVAAAARPRKNNPKSRRTGSPARNGWSRRLLRTKGGHRRLSASSLPLASQAAPVSMTGAGGNPAGRRGSGPPR